MTVPRKTAFGLGLITVGMFAYGVLGQDERDRICTPGFSASIRPSVEITERIKRQMLIDADLCTMPPLPDLTWEWHCPVAHYEFDHIVPLCLDGAPLDPANLQLERWPAARKKDHIEAATCRAYCAGKIELPEARARFHRD